MRKLTDEQKIEIALDMLCAKLTHVEVCRKHGISVSYAYKIRDRAVKILRAGIGGPARETKKRIAWLAKRVQHLEQLTVDQALAISILKMRLRADRKPLSNRLLLMKK